MTSLRALRNIGPKSEQVLSQIGIHTLEDLERVGVVDAYLRAKSRFPDKVSLNLLYALQGAMLGIPWDKLPEEVKRDMKRQVSSH